MSHWNKASAAPKRINISCGIVNPIDKPLLSEEDVLAVEEPDGVAVTVAMKLAHDC